MFVVTKHIFCHVESFCCDKIMLVIFVVTKLVGTNICGDKHVFVVTKVLS